MGESFASVFVNDFNYEEVGHQRCDGNLRDIVFNHLGLERLLKMLNGSSACGPDGIHPSILKACSEAVAWPLYKIFRRSLNTGMLPRLWKTSSVIPLHKGGLSE